MRVTKSQSAAPRAARLEARRATYDKGQTLQQDFIASPLNIQTKNHTYQSLRNSSGWLNSILPEGGVSLSRNGIQAKQSTRFSVFNTDGRQIVGNSNLKKNTLQNTLRVSSSASMTGALGNGLTIPVLRVSINNGTIGHGAAAVSNGFRKNFEATLFTPRANRSLGLATQNILPISTQFTTLNPGYSAKNDLQLAHGDSPPFRNPYHRGFAFNDVSADITSRTSTHFMINVRSHGTAIRGVIFRSGISWQQTKNDESFLRTLKYRNP